jgi:hypothetical protein
LTDILFLDLDYLLESYVMKKKKLKKILIMKKKKLTDFYDLNLKEKY